MHVPAGAIPKDGPSAGITMTTALASLLSGRPVRHTVGMTGEVTLQGRVLPIGGLKQKVLAAHAAGLTDVILPERNRADLDDVPEEVREQLTFHPVMTIGEVLDLALEPERVAAQGLDGLGEAAVHEQRDSGHVARGLRAEEGGSGADLLDSCPSGRWAPARRPLPPRPRASRRSASGGRSRSGRAGWSSRSRRRARPRVRAA